MFLDYLRAALVPPYETTTRTYSNAISNGDTTTSFAIRYARRSFRRRISVVPQDTVLFNDTVAYNIGYGDLSTSRDDIVAAAKKAKIHDTILTFPQGYDTVVGERGLKLSGGEKQRVSIARAVLKGGDILFCDEPTSSLDGQTEREIMDNLKDLGRDRTMIIIAHRLTTVQESDEIVVLKEGRVNERGRHEELLARRGTYWEMWERQSKIGEEEEQDGKLKKD